MDELKRHRRWAVAVWFVTFIVQMPWVAVSTFSAANIGIRIAPAFVGLLGLAVSLYAAWVYWHAWIIYGRSLVEVPLDIGHRDQIAATLREAKNVFRGVLAPYVNSPNIEVQQSGAVTIAQATIVDFDEELRDVQRLCDYLPAQKEDPSAALHADFHARARRASLPLTQKLGHDENRLFDEGHFEACDRELTILAAKIWRDAASVRRVARFSALGLNAFVPAALCVAAALFSVVGMCTDSWQLPVVSVQ